MTRDNSQGLSTVYVIQSHGHLTSDQCQWDVTQAKRRRFPLSCCLSGAAPVMGRLDPDRGQTASACCCQPLTCRPRRSFRSPGLRGGHCFVPYVCSLNLDFTHTRTDCFVSSEPSGARKDNLCASTSTRKIILIHLFLHLLGGNWCELKPQSLWRALLLASRGAQYSQDSPPISLYTG